MLWEAFILLPWFFWLSNLSCNETFLSKIGWSLPGRLRPNPQCTRTQWMVWWGWRLPSHQISTQSNTCGRFGSIVLDNILHHHQLRKYLLEEHLSSTVPEACRINAKVHQSCLGDLWWPKSFHHFSLNLSPNKRENKNVNWTINMNKTMLPPNNNNKKS